MSNPYKVETVRCAGPGCANLRREINHWFVIGASKEAETGAGTFYCRALDPGFAIGEKEQPVCGQACAQKLFEQFLAGGNNSDRMIRAGAE